MDKKYTAIIVAAGTGKRMNSPVKKQYMEIGGYPVLYHTLKAFENSRTDEIIVVTGADEVEFVKKDIVEKYGFKKVSAVCPGGRERYDSVYEGIKLILQREKVFCNGLLPGDENATADRQEKDVERFVLIHDGVRPLISVELINRCIESVTECGACIPGVAEKDTVKEADTGMVVLKTHDRKHLYRIQTPQCFGLSLIDLAFERYYGEKKSQGRVPDITDDAMLVEKYTGCSVKIIEGEYENIKITTPEDIGLAEFFLKKSLDIG